MKNMEHFLGNFFFNILFFFLVSFQPNESGFVLLSDTCLDTSTDTDEMWQQMGPPSPCDVEFINANIIIDGKSSIRNRSTKELHVSLTFFTYIFYVCNIFLTLLRKIITRIFFYLFNQKVSGWLMTCSWEIFISQIFSIFCYN